MKVICDSSVLIGLTSIGKLELVRKVLEVEEVTIPQAVWQEVVKEGQGRKGAAKVKSAKWIKNQTRDGIAGVGDNWNSHSG